MIPSSTGCTTATAPQKILIDYGFRLPSAYDNRPLRFHEFEQYMGMWSLSGNTGRVRAEEVPNPVEQIIRRPVLSIPESRSGRSWARWMT